MIINETNLLRESINDYLILESRQILLENIKNNPKKYFVINEHYKQFCNEEEWDIIQEGIWDTIKDVAGKIGDWFSNNPRQGIQSIADIVSIVDPTGIVDLVNGIFYYYFKDYFSAFFSFLGAALTMGGLLLTATAAGAIAGVPMEVAGKAVQTTKVAVKTGKVASTGAKEIGIATKIAMPAITKISKIIEKIPFFGGAGKWITKSADDVVEVAMKKGSKIEDVSKALNAGGSTEIATNPVVKSLTGRVVDAVKKQGVKPSLLQTGFAGLGVYGIYLQADDYQIEKIATEELKQAAQDEGITFDPNDEEDKDLLQAQIQFHKTKIKNCKAGEDCRYFIEKNPIISTVLSGLGSFGQKGGEVLKSFDPRAEKTT